MHFEMCVFIKVIWIPARDQTTGEIKEEEKKTGIFIHSRHFCESFIWKKAPLSYSSATVSRLKVVSTMGEQTFQRLSEMVVLLLPAADDAHGAEELSLCCPETRAHLKLIRRTACHLNFKAMLFLVWRHFLTENSQIVATPRDRPKTTGYFF